MGLPFRKSGGGYFNNVAGVIVGILFELKSGGEGDKAWRILKATLTAKIDGAEELMTTIVDGGFLREADVKVAGAVISGVEDCPINSDSELAGFVASIVEANGDLEKEVGTGLDYSWLSGLRVNFVKAIDEARNKKDGKRKGKPGSKHAGKEFNHELLRVSKVFGREDVKKLQAQAKAAAPAQGSKPTSAPASAPAATNTNVDDAATKAILTIVGKAKDKKVKAANLGGAFVKYALEANIESGEDRERIRNRMTDEAFIAGLVEQELITFDGKVIGATE